MYKPFKWWKFAKKLNLEIHGVQVFPCGLVARIWRFHRHGPSSIPGMGNIVFQTLFSKLVENFFLMQE